MGDEDNIGEIDPERLARFMVKQLRAMPEEQRADHLARLKEDMPLIHGMVTMALNSSAPMSIPPGEESTGDGEDDKAPEGKFSKAIQGFGNLVDILRGGGVWAALATSLLLNCWLGWRIQVVNDKMVDVLMAVKFKEEGDLLPASFSPTASIPPTERPPEFNPHKVLADAQEDYSHLIEQRISAGH
jgi:hypothetical protein